MRRKAPWSPLCWIREVCGPVKVNLSSKEGCFKAFLGKKKRNKDASAFQYNEISFIWLVWENLRKRI